MTLHAIAKRLLAFVRAAEARAQQSARYRPARRLADQLEVIEAALCEVQATERARCLEICEQHASCEGIAQQIAAQIKAGRA